MIRSHLLLLAFIGINLHSCFEITVEDISHQNETDDSQFQALLEIVAFKDILEATTRDPPTPPATLITTTKTPVADTVFEQGLLLGRLLSFIQNLHTFQPPVYNTNIHLNLFRSEKALATAPTTQPLPPTTTTKAYSATTEDT